MWNRLKSISKEKLEFRLNLGFYVLVLFFYFIKIFIFTFVLINMLTLILSIIFHFFPRVSQNTEKQFWEWSYKTIFQQNWISLYSTLPNINNIGLAPVLVYQARKWLQLWRKTVHSTCTRKTPHALYIIQNYIL